MANSVDCLGIKLPSRKQYRAGAVLNALVKGSIGCKIEEALPILELVRGALAEKDLVVLDREKGDCLLSCRKQASYPTPLRLASVLAPGNGRLRRISPRLSSQPRFVNYICFTSLFPKENRGIKTLYEEARTLDKHNIAPDPNSHSWHVMPQEGQG